jgi:hypothetical protein
LAGRQIAAHSDEFVMQMVVAKNKADPLLNTLTKEELEKSDRVYKIMKFVSQMAGQFQYTTNETADATIGLIGKLLLQAPRWTASNVFFMYGINQALSHPSVLGKVMGGRANRSLDIYVKPEDGPFKGYLNDRTFRDQINTSIGGLLYILATTFLVPQIIQMFYQHGKKYLVRTGNKVGGMRTGDWEYKDTFGYSDPYNKIASPLLKAREAAAKRPGMPEKGDENPAATDVMEKLRPYGWGWSPVITRPAGWFITGKDAIDRNLYDPDKNVSIMYDRVWKPMIEKATGKKMPAYLEVPRLYTEQFWSWFQAGMEAGAKSAEFGEPDEKVAQRALIATILSGIGTGWQFNPEPNENQLQQYQRAKQYERSKRGQKLLGNTKPDDFKIKLRD